MIFAPVRDSCQRVCTLSCDVIFNSSNTTATRIHMVPNSSLSNGVYISVFVVSNSNFNACMRCHPWIRFCSQLQWALTVVTQLIKKILILSRNQCRYIYLYHNLEDCYLKYRLHIHLLNIMVLKVEKSEKYCQNWMCSVDKIIYGHSVCCDFCTCERFLSTRVYTFMWRHI